MRVVRRARDKRSLTKLQKYQHTSGIEPANLKLELCMGQGPTAATTNDDNGGEHLLDFASTAGVTNWLVGWLYCGHFALWKLSFVNHWLAPADDQ